MDQFLDPRVAELRERLSLALEAAGHTVHNEARRFPVPAVGDLAAGNAIVGNLQSTDSQNQAYAYYIRPADVRPVVPEWFSAVVRASYSADERASVFLVVEEATEEVAADARACGAGVLVIAEGDALERYVDPSPPEERLTDHEFAREVTQVRQAIVSCSTLRLRRTQERWTDVVDVAAGAGPESAAQITFLEGEHDRIVAWRDDMERRLRAAERARDVEMVRALYDRIDEERRR